MVVVWLSPGVPRSVAPSGMPEPTTSGPVTGPFDPETVPPAPEPLLLKEVEPQLLDRPDPPPSKAEFELVLGHGIISGLTPGVLISVEPSGIPPRPDELNEELPEEGAPSGEVGPMPGVVVVCACAATIPIQQPMAASSKSGYRIERPQARVADVSLTRPGKVEDAKAQRLREWCRRSLSPEHGDAGLVPLRSPGFAALQKPASGNSADFASIYGHFDVDP